MKTSFSAIRAESGADVASRIMEEVRKGGDVRKAASRSGKTSRTRLEGTGILLKLIDELRKEKPS